MGGALEAWKHWRRGSTRGVVAIEYRGALGPRAIQLLQTMASEAGEDMHIPAARLVREWREWRCGLEVELAFETAQALRASAAPIA